MKYENSKYSDRKANVGVTVVPFIFEDNTLKVLVYKRDKNSEVFPNFYSLPNCFFDISILSDLNEAAKFALENKTNVRMPYIEQVHTFSGNHIDPERINTVNIAYLALAQKDDIETLNESEFKSEWLPVNDIINKELAFNHNEVLNVVLERLKSKAEYTNISCYLLHSKFTITELRKVTEYLIDAKLDNSRFRDRISKSGIISEIEGEFKKGVQRPAQLYSINFEYNGYFYPKSLTKPS